MRWAVVAGSERLPPLPVAELDRATIHAGLTDLTGWEPPVGSDAIALVGSDHDLARLALGSHRAGWDLPIALIPTGRSDLLRMFGLDRDLMMERIGGGEPYPADLGVATLGGVAYPFVAHAVSRPAFRSRLVAQEVVVAADDREHRAHSWLVAVANAQHLGPWTIAPRAAVMDGRLDVQVLGGSLRVRPRLWRMLRRGLHAPMSAVWRRAAGEVDGAVPPSWRLFTDGVRVGTGPFSATVEAGAFSLWI